MPLTKLESLDARKSATVAISSGRPISPRGIWDLKNSLAAGPSGSRIGVSMVPGLRMLTRILRSLSSTSQVRAKERRKRRVTGRARYYFERTPANGRHVPARFRGGAATRFRFEGCPNPESDGAAVRRAPGAFRWNRYNVTRRTQ